MVARYQTILAFHSRAYGAQSHIAPMAQGVSKLCSELNQFV